jgi:hypothetical protein
MTFIRADPAYLTRFSPEGTDAGSGGFAFITLDRLKEKFFGLPGILTN